MATCTTIPSFHRDYVQLNHPSSPTIPHRINPLYNKATIRPDHQQHDTNFYFQENLNNDIVQIKNKNNILLSSPILVPSNPVHPSPPVSSWTTFPKYSVDYTHRDSLTGDATLTSNTNGIVTAGSSTADSIVKAEELKSANMVYSVDSKENAKRSSIDMHHSMNFANYM
ncbi:hypothetical protein BD560DRAFT_422309 [Blakeslea trispora]|nr:hypothetical protein BD560DRAFT_422309 [Blakeslea trispora]